MCPVNVNNPEYVKAERDYDTATTLEEKISATKIMISHMPGHKGAEKLRAQLRTRYKKLLEQQDKAKKSGKSSQIGIKKDDMQTVIIGFTNSGKSTLLTKLTNAEPKISEVKFTTTQPQIGMIKYSPGVQVQLIENPSIESEFYDKGITNSADTLIILIDKEEQIEKILQKIKHSSAKKIIVFNKTENLSEEEKRKLSARLSSKKYNFVLVSAKENQNLEELKNKIFENFGKIRVYTKEPGKEINFQKDKPMILKPNATIKDVAEKILKGFSNTIKETKITGPSSKFSNQKVGLKHKVKDLDVVEFKTK